MEVCRFLTFPKREKVYLWNKVKISRMHSTLKRYFASFSILALLLFFACASHNATGYKPKYKKPNPNKPLPCPMKDC